MKRRFIPFVVASLLMVAAVAGGTVFALSSQGTTEPAPTAAVTLPAAASQSSVPSLMNFQGRLTDAQGQAINGNVQVTFRIYDVATGDSPLWEEVQSVTAQDGLFSVLLGSAAPLMPTIFSTGTERWLGIQISGDAEMSPRLRVASVPYALVAAQAKTSTTLNGLSASDFTTTADLDSHAVDQDAHHIRFTDAEAVAAMGAKTGDNPLHHDRYGDSEAVSAVLAADGPDSGLDADTLDGLTASDFTTTGDLGGHVADPDDHHTRYSDTEAVAAMGAKTGDNPLHHDQYVDSEAVSAVLAADGPDSGLDADTLDGLTASDFTTTGDLGGHIVDPDAHHTRYTDPEAVAAILTEELITNKLDELRGPDQAFLQGAVEQAMGLPVQGRSDFQQFLSDQWRIAATEYLLLQRGLLGGLGEGNEEQTFQEYLAGREGSWSRMQGDFLGALTSMDSNEQIQLLEGLGEFREQAMQQVYLNRLRDLYVGFIAEAKLSQHFSDAEKGAYAVSPGALQDNPVPFLNYLQDKYLSGD